MKIDCEMITLNACIENGLLKLQNAPCYLLILINALINDNKRLTSDLEKGHVKDSNIKIIK